MTQAVEHKKSDQGTPGESREKPGKRRSMRLPYRLISAFLAGMLLVSVAGGAYIWTNPPSSGTVTSAPTIQASSKGSSIDAAKIYKADAPGVVQVESEISGDSQGLFGPAPSQGTALGSGFVVDGRTSSHFEDSARLADYPDSGNARESARKLPGLIRTKPGESICSRPWF